jgi:hypothetical protein
MRRECEPTRHRPRALTKVTTVVGSELVDAERVWRKECWWIDRDETQTVCRRARLAVALRISCGWASVGLELAAKGPSDQTRRWSTDT